MTTVNALREDKILAIGEAVGTGDITPVEGFNKLHQLGYAIPDAHDAVLHALDFGEREHCDRCEGMGTVGTPYSGSDPVCVYCGGRGSVSDD